MDNKWKIIAVIETVLIAVVVVFAVGFFVGRGNKSGKEASAQEAQTTQTTDNDSAKQENSTEQEASKQQETETSTEKSTTKEAFEIAASNDGLKLSFELVQGWENGEDHFYNYSAVVENTGKEPVSEWAAKVPVGEDFKLDSFWNAECEVIDGYLCITPVEFNKALEPGAKIDSVGFIFSCKKEASFEGAVIGQKQETNSTGDQNDAKNQESGKTQSGGTAITTYQGKLSVNGTNLVDQNNNIVQLRGISTHGIAWYPDYVNYDSFKTLRDEFGANVIRLAMYTGENGGYCTGGNQQELKKLVENGVKYATDLSMYVIIDWHILSDNNPNTNKDAAKAFFEEMSKKYADYDNVLYEICNEPNGGTSWADVKKYAEEIIPVIRKNDKDGIILVGTPTWSQDVDKALADPITGYDNIMYVLHFYAATHKDDLRNKMIKAIDGGLPVFISEFSICDASGNGGIDYDSAKKWLDVINQYHISYVGWNLSNKNESSAILKPSCTKTSGYTMDDLSDTGKWLVESFR